MKVTAEERSARKRAYYLRNRERVLARVTAYRNSERGKTQKARWRASNREKVREQDWQWKTRNRARVRKYAQRWRASNLERARKQRRDSYARNKDQQRAQLRAYAKSALGRATRRAWRERNREALLLAQRRWRQRQDSERLRASYRDQYLKHREKRLRQQKDYRMARVEQIQAYNRRRHRVASDTMSDRYVKTLIRASTKLSAKAFPAPLIEARRSLLAAKRLLKENRK